MKKAENALIICTDKRLIGRYERVLREMEIDIDIEYVGNRFGANIEAALNYIDQFREQGKEIIITRGFMAQETVSYTHLTGMTSDEFCDYALDKCRLALIPGDAFGDCGKGFVRMSYATSMENLEKAVACLRELDEDFSK